MLYVSGRELQYRTQRGVVDRPFRSGELYGWHVRQYGAKATVRIYSEHDGTAWIRGWRTKAARAFEVAIALGAPI